MDSCMWHYQKPATCSSKAKMFRKSGKAFDGIMRTCWQPKYAGGWLLFDLHKPRYIAALHIAWDRGNKHSRMFRIDVSNNKNEWKNAFIGKTTGKTAFYETCVLNSPQLVRYVRIGCADKNWKKFAVSEVSFDGLDAYKKHSVPMMMKMGDLPKLEPAPVPAKPKKKPMPKMKKTKKCKRSFLSYLWPFGRKCDDKKKAEMKKKTGQTEMKPMKKKPVKKVKKSKRSFFSYLWPFGRKSDNKKKAEMKKATKKPEMKPMKMKEKEQPKAKPKKKTKKKSFFRYLWPF